ncbi:MAG: HDOD domain-containing protein [bacterium]|nr:HDOD domain-containing protein [bacterium]
MELAAIDNKVKQVVSNIRNLPTPPIVFHQIQKVMSNPDVSASQIANILAEDPAMSVKVLKLTNSAFYGLAREVDSVKHAVVIVGIEAIKNLVLSASVLGMFKSDQIDQEFMDRHWRHSLATGFCCRLLAQKVKSRGFLNPDSAFSAGLLHDIGKIVISCFLPEEFKQFREARESDQIAPDFMVEQRTIGFDHAQVGGVLTLQWKLPQKLTEAIAFHHNPTKSGEEEPMTYLLSLGNFIAKKTLYSDEEEHLVGAVDSDVIEFFGFEESDIEGFSDQLREEYGKAETFLQIAGMG